MGPKYSQIDSNKILENNNIRVNENVSRYSFEYISVIGRGGFGKVWKVILKATKKQYALKELNKAKLIDKKCDTNLRYEKDLLSKINHPFIVNMHFAFQDKDNVYFVMDLLTGGDLRFHLQKVRNFTEEQTKFFIACIVLGLEYLHWNNVMHRDIKPENLVLDAKGYLKLTDFGVAKYYQKENAHDSSGTPGYMAPEVMCCQNHGFVVDYFAVGIIAYEFMKGRRPYCGRGRKELKEKIMSKQARIKKDEIPNGWSIESADCINRLLQRKPVNRLGLKGATEIKEHSWFKYYPWTELYLRKLNSPFVPKNIDNFDSKYCNNAEHISMKTKERYLNIVNNSYYLEAFKNFKYFSRFELDMAEKNNVKIKKFLNLHDIIYSEIDAKSSENDACVINRNILSNKSTDDELHSSDGKKKPKAPFQLYKLYNQTRNLSNHKSKMSTSLSLIRGTKNINYGNTSFKNDYNNMSASFRSSKKSKAAGFGY